MGTVAALEGYTLLLHFRYRQRQDQGQASPRSRKLHEALDGSGYSVHRDSFGKHTPYDASRHRQPSELGLKRDNMALLARNRLVSMGNQRRHSQLEAI